MQRFYLLYPKANTILPQVGEEIFMIPWGHHKVIMDKYQDDVNKAMFFVRKTIANNWSRGLLENFIDTDLYERQGHAITNFQSALPQPHGDLAQEITKDPPPDMKSSLCHSRGKLSLSKSETVARF